MHLFCKKKKNKPKANEERKITKYKSDQTKQTPKRTSFAPTTTSSLPFVVILLLCNSSTRMQTQHSHEAELEKFYSHIKSEVTCSGTKGNLRLFHYSKISCEHSLRVQELQVQWCPVKADAEVQLFATSYQRARACHHLSAEVL